MTFIRIADIPADELHLLPIIGLRRQIREDRNRPTLGNGPTVQPKGDASRPGQAARQTPVAGGGFVTDWQLQNETCQSSRLPDEGSGRMTSTANALVVDSKPPVGPGGPHPREPRSDGEAPDVDEDLDPEDSEDEHFDDGAHDV